MEMSPAVITKKREILNRAVVDPQFRENLFSKPEETLKQYNLSDEEKKLILPSLDERMLGFIKSMDDSIGLLSESILCAR